MRHVVIFALVVAAPATAQPFSRGDFWKGTHAFRAALSKEGFQPVDSFEALAEEADKSVLILLGKSDRLDPLCETGQLKAFFRGGGALLLATDQQTSSTVYSTMRVRVDGRFVTSPVSCYRDNLPECPLLTETRTLLGGRNPLFSGLPDRPTVATNRPSVLRDSGLWPALATLPADVDFRFGGVPVGRGPARFAIGGRVEDGGRLLVMADHSLFINDMMLQRDNDNIAFTFNVLKWLGEDGKRTRVLLYEDGEVQTDFKVSLDYADPPLPPFEALIPVANKFLGGLEDEDAFNKTLLSVINHRTLLRTTIFAFTIALLVWGLYRFLNSRVRVDRLPQVPTVSAAALDIDRRRDALVAQGNFGEAARELSRQTLAHWGALTSSDMEVRGSWPVRRRWTRQIERLRTIATQDGLRVSATDLSRLVADLHAFEAAAANGTLKLDTGRATR
ncbi:MAG: DUF4350 domain-containing protein [Gemmataceae bacterium]